MRLADLKADLADNAAWPDGSVKPSVRVARRVAELFTECGGCEGTGFIGGVAVWRDDGRLGMDALQCFSCNGLGVGLSDVVLSHGDYELEGGIWWLARFLFGEEP